MTPKQQAFINYYTNINNPKTFGNATQSTIKAYNNNNHNYAKVQGSRLIANDNIKSEIDRVLKELNLDSKVRLKAIKEVILANYKQETETISTDKAGNTYTAKTYKTPSARERLQAVDLIEKISGTYDKNKAKADIMSSELKSLIKQQRKELEAETRERVRGK